MGQHFVNTTASGTLAHAYTSRVSFAANATRTKGFVVNLSRYAPLHVSADHGTGVGSVPIAPGDTLVFTNDPDWLTAAIFVTGTTDNQTFTFDEHADAPSAATVS